MEEINNSSHNTKIPFEVNNIDNESILISIKTIKNCICPSSTKKIIIYDSNNNENNLYNEIVFSDAIFSIQKITLDNKNYLYFSSGNNNDLYLIEDNKTLKKVENPSFEPFKNEKINKIIILDDKNIVAVVGGIKLSFYEYKNEQYTKFFNNINKYGNIYELHKLQNNSYYFLARQDYNSIIMIQFNEDFTSKEKEMDIRGPTKHLKNNILFKIKHNRVVIIGFKEFIIFNLNSFEEQTIVSEGLICCALPFNNIIDKDYYDYFALIIHEKDQFYLKIFCLISDDTFDVIKINLNEYSSKFEALIDDNDIKSNCRANDIKKDKDNEDKKNELFHSISHRLSPLSSNPNYNINNNIDNDLDDDLNNVLDDLNNNLNNNLDSDLDKDSDNIFDKNLNNFYNNLFFHFSNKDLDKNAYFDMVYDINNDGKVVLIISLFRSWVNEKFTIMLNVDLNNLDFI